MLFIEKFSKNFFAFGISGFNCLFNCVVSSTVNFSYFCSPIISVLVKFYARVSRFIVSPERFCVYSILRRCSLPKIENSVIVPYSIDVINLAFWPISINKKPSKSVRLERKTVQPYSFISSIFNRSNFLSNFDTWSWLYSPIKLPTFRIISESFFQSFSCWSFFEHILNYSAWHLKRQV